MRRERFSKEQLEQFLEKQKAATLPELKKVLGGVATMTVFRKLKDLNYCTSISHSGKYYCLQQTARFDRVGLWRWKDILFASSGNLAEAVEGFIENSEVGYRSSEIEALLSLKPNEVLLKLVEQKRIYREKLGKSYVYFARSLRLREAQKLRRVQNEAGEPWSQLRPEVLMNELKAAIVLFFSLLNEKQRRLYAGLESLKAGRGGDEIISEVLGINKKTVRRGRLELLDQGITLETIRSGGGGRKKLLKKNTASTKKS